MSTLSEQRVAEVGRHVTDAADETVRKHPALAGTIRHSFDRLRDGLTLAHRRCDAVDDGAWARYVTDLDSGLDELDQEIARAAEQPTADESVDDVLVVHLTGIELQGWRLQVSLPAVESRLATAETELKRYESAGTTGGAKPTAALDRAMDDLRAAA